MKSLNVKDFGAQGNGTADDTAEFRNALMQLRAEGGGELLVPPGIYLLSGVLSVRDLPIAFRGCGRDLTILRWNDGTGGIEYLVTGGGGRTLCLSSLSLETLQRSGGPGIRGTWPGGTSMEAYCQLDDVRISGATNTSSWTYGLWLRNANGIKLHNIYIKGNFTVDDNALPQPWCCQAAIHLEGADGGKISHMFTNLGVERCNRAIEIHGWYEGIYLTNFEFAYVGTGVYGRVSTNVPGLTTSPNLFIQNGHINFRNYGTDIHDFLNVKLINVDLFKDGDAHAPSGLQGYDGNAVSLERCQNFSLSACKFESTHKEGTNENGLFAMEGSDRGVVMGCHFLNFRASSIFVDASSAIISGNFVSLHQTSTGLFFGGHSSNCVANGNIITGPGTSVTNNGQGNLIH